MNVKQAGWLYTSPSGRTHHAAPLDEREQSLCDEGWTETPLYSADTIAALKKDAERLDWLDKHPREATIRVGTDMKACVFYGVSCDPKWTMREAIDAAIDAAQSTEGKR